MSRRFRIALSLACAALVAVSFAAYADQVQAEAEQERSDALMRYGGEVVTLVVATRNLEAGEELSAADLSARDWLVDLAPENAITAMEDAVGLALSEPVAKGVPLTAFNFRDGSEPIEVPSGRIAVSIPVNDKTGIAREVAVGSELIAYAVDDDGVDLVSGSLSVLTVPVAGSWASTTSITLAALPQDVAAVLEASASGRLRLVMPADDAVGLVVEDAALQEAEAPTEVPAEEAGNQDTASDAGQQEAEAPIEAA